MPKAERRSRADVADELEGAFDSWEYQLHEMQESELSRHDPFYRMALAEVPALLSPVRLASRRNPNGTRAALRLGLLMGMWQGRPAAIHRKREASDVARGRKVKSAAAAGGRVRWRTEERDKQIEAARERVTAVHQDHPRRSWTDVCKQVGKERRVSDKTIQRYTAAVRW
jgi:hypothetical protein